MCQHEEPRKKNVSCSCTWLVACLPHERTTTMCSWCLFVDPPNNLASHEFEVYHPRARAHKPLPLLWFPAKPSNSQKAFLTQSARTAVVSQAFNRLAVLWESQLMARSQQMSQQSRFPPYIRHYGVSDSQPNTREFGNRNQERRHRQEGDSCSSRITKNTGTAQGDSNRGRCVRTGAVPKFTYL